MDCDESRRDPRCSSRMRWSALRQRDLSGGGPRLAAEVLQVRRDEDADPRHVDDAGHAEDVRAIVGQPPVRVREVVGIAAEHVRSAPRC